MNLDKTMIDNILEMPPDCSKMIVVNDRYFCTFVHKDAKKAFSAPEKDLCSSSMFQEADVDIVDMSIDEDHHRNGSGKIYYCCNNDLLTSKDSMSMMLNDESLVSAVKVNVEDKPYDLNELLKRLKHKPASSTLSIDVCKEGVVLVNLLRMDNIIADIEYYINGRLHFAIVDASDVENAEIVCMVNCERLSKTNVDSIAEAIDSKIDSLKTSI